MSGWINYSRTDDPLIFVTGRGKQYKNYTRRGVVLVDTSILEELGISVVSQDENYIVYNKGLGYAVTRKPHIGIWYDNPISPVKKIDNIYFEACIGFNQAKDILEKVLNEQRNIRK